MATTRQKFLSGENTNSVLQEIIKNLNNYGVDVNIKDLQTKIFNFMNDVYSRYPNDPISKLNNFVIQTSINKYAKGNQTAVNQSSRKQSVEGEFERQLAERKYNAAQGQPPGQQNPFDPRGTPTQKSSPTGGMSLNQVLNGGDALDEDVPEPPELEGPPIPSSRVDYEDEPDISNENLPVNQHVKQSNNELWLSLSKEDLVNVDGNKFTFCWNSKIIPDFGGNFRAELKYITLPKNYSHLLAKYGGDGRKTSKGTNRVFNATGKNYSAKLIPCHTSEEHTTYQALGGQSGLIEGNTLPTTLTFSIISPNGEMDLNLVPVQRVIKTDRKIQVFTKTPHNLVEKDKLTLEFPKQHVCYRITNLEIISDRQITFSSPFSGYFSSDFRLLRNNWNLDLTLLCRYRSKFV